MRIKRRTLKRIIAEAVGSAPTLSLDLGPGGDFPTLGNTATDDTWGVPDFGSSNELVQAVSSTLPGVSADTPVKDYDLGLGTLALGQVYDAVMGLQ